MQLAVPIVTEAGLLKGRDAVFLDRIESDGLELVLAGDINSGLSSAGTGVMIPYRLTFIGVISSFTCELDSHETIPENQFPYPAPYASSFDLIENSLYLARLPVRGDYDKTRYRHYCLSTYDHIFHVIAEGYFLRLADKIRQKL